MATQNLGRVGLVLKGEWDSTTAYTALDVVSHDGNAWAAKQNSTNVEPTTGNSDFWQLFSNNADLVATVQGYKEDAASSAEAAAASAADAEASAQYGEDAFNAIAHTFSTSTAYTTGQYVWYEGELYRFNTAHPAGAWIGTDAARYTATDEFPLIQRALSNKADAEEVADLKSALNTFAVDNIVNVSGWSQGSIDVTTGSTISSTNRCRTGFMQFDNVGFYNITIRPKAGYKCSIADYSTNNVSGFVGSISNMSASERTITINPTHYYKFVVGASDDSDLAPSNVPADAVAYAYVSYTDKTLTEQNKAADALGTGAAIEDINARLPHVVLNWHMFATAEYPTGWRVGSWTDGGAHNTGAGNAIHLIRMLTKSDMIGVERIKFVWTGAYTMLVKVFLRSAPTTLYRRYDITSGTVLNIDPALDAFYGVTLAGFGTGAQTALDNDYPDNIVITQIRDASDGIAKRFKNRDSDFFTVPVSSSYPSGDSDSSGTINVDCVLRLPSDYSPTGDPTKLIFMHHGNSGTVNAENETWYSESGVWINFVNAYLDAGYAVFDVNGCGPASDSNASHDYAAFGALEAAFKAYQYIVTNYNINPKILVHGSSMGGATAYAFAKLFGHIVDAVGLFSPALLSRSAQMPSVYDYIAVNYGYADYAAMVADNYMRLVPSSPTIEYYANGVKTTKAYTYDWVNQHDTDGLDIACKDFGMPIKIWCGTADTSVDPKYGEELAKAITNSGGMALFRPISGGEHSAGLGGNATVNAEAVMWFERFR